MDQPFTTRKKCQHINAYQIFIDSKQAYDAIDRNVLHIMIMRDVESPADENGNADSTSQDPKRFEKHISDTNPQCVDIFLFYLSWL